MMMMMMMMVMNGQMNYVQATSTARFTAIERHGCDEEDEEN